MSSQKKGILDRFKDGEVVIAAEGYIMELERRGYCKFGSFVPEVVLDRPEKVEELARELVYAGADMCQAFTYYSHREKMKDIGRENEFETLNQRAHEIAKKVAEETGVLFCSGVGTTNVYDPNSPEKMQKCEELLREQIAFSAKYGVDYICIETLWDYGEASIALKVCKEFNIPAVITLAPVDFSGEMKTFDGYKLGDALKLLEDEGAACVGLNCARGPETIIPLIRDIRKQIKGPLACVCLGYKTTEEECTWYMLKHPRTGVKSFPMNLLAHCLGRSDLEWYAKELKDIGVNYVGMCCGNCPTYTRTIAMEFGRTPPAAKYGFLKQDSL